MMKIQMLLAVWGLLAVYASSAAVEPVREAELATLDEGEGPVQIIESLEDIDLDDGFTGAVGRSNVRLFRQTFSRGAVANAVLFHTIRYTGRAATRISSVRWVHLSSLGTSARIIAGGVNRNTVTVEIETARGRGFHTEIEILGRY